MADLSPAEAMLDSLVPAQRLIRRLQAILTAPVPHVDKNPSPALKAKIAAFLDNVQRRIDELTAQREEIVALIQQIPDQTARTVIELRYGLIGSGCELMPYPKVGEALNYADKTIFRYRHDGIEQMNQILENRS